MGTKGGRSVTSIRRFGIALGSLVIAWLVIGLVWEPTIGAFGGLVTVVLGAAIYLDIIRRERRPAP
jgi:hypothetical protein